MPMAFRAIRGEGVARDGVRVQGKRREGKAREYSANYHRLLAVVEEMTTIN